MKSDGKSLEAFVAFVEETLLQKGLSVATRERVVVDGKVVAEFDITVRGKVGSTDFAWLIECRDRPSDGAQGTDWIEQLVGRRARFTFNKVTAVSTTGFAVAAETYASSQGIELREVRSLAPEAFGDDWLHVEFMEQNYSYAQLEHAGIVFPQNTDPRQISELQAITGSDLRKLVLKSSKTGATSDPAGAFLGIVQQNGWFGDVQPNGPRKTVEVLVHYANDDDHFVVETQSGAARVESIAFKGYLSVTKTLVPFARKAEYIKAGDKGQISRYAAFEPIEVNGAPIAIELHRMESTGETHLVARVLEKK